MANALGCDVRYDLVPRQTLTAQVRARAEVLARERAEPEPAEADDEELARLHDEFELVVRNLMNSPRRSFW